MSYGRMLSHYQKTNVETAGQVDLIVMCYENIIHSLEQARAFYGEKEFEKKAKMVQKALDIISELKCSLDFEKGGQIASNLDNLYTYISKSIIEADIERDYNRFIKLAQMMSQLKEGWEGIASKADEENPIKMIGEVLPDGATANAGP